MDEAVSQQPSLVAFLLATIVFAPCRQPAIISPSLCQSHSKWSPITNQVPSLTHPASDAELKTTAPNSLLVVLPTAALLVVTVLAPLQLAIQSHLMLLLVPREHRPQALPRACRPRLLVSKVVREAKPAAASDSLDELSLHRISMSWWSLRCHCCHEGIVLSGQCASRDLHSWFYGICTW